MALNELPRLLPIARSWANSAHELIRRCTEEELAQRRVDTASLKIAGELRQCDQLITQVEAQIAMLEATVAEIDRAIEERES